MSVQTDTSMTIRMNKEIKQQAQQIFANLGMDMTTAINIFLRQAIYYKGFPFDVRLQGENGKKICGAEESSKELEEK